MRLIFMASIRSIPGPRAPLSAPAGLACCCRWPRSTILAGEGQDAAMPQRALRRRRHPEPRPCRSPRASAPSRKPSTPMPRSRVLRDATRGADDGELFLERRRAESLVFDDGRLRNAAYDAAEGFGLRAVRGETAGYAHSTEISEAALRRAAETARLAVGAGGGTLAAAPKPTNQRLYTDRDPFDDAEFAVKVEMLREIDAYLRGLDPRVVQVSATPRRLDAGGGDPPPRRHPPRRGPPHGPPQHLRHRRGERPPRIGLRRRRRPPRPRAAHGHRPLARRSPRRRSASPPSTSAPSPPPPASWTSSSAPAGPASSCTRRSATASRATSTASRPRPSPASWAPASPPPASPSSTTAPSPTAAARSASTTRAPPRSATS